MQWSGHYLVNPWTADGLVDLAAYPTLRAHYKRHYDRLRKRHTAKNRPAQWYRTIDRVNHELLHKHKLYIADIKERITPVPDAGQTYPHHNLYVVESRDWDLAVLGGLLLSAIGQFFVECYGVRMRGGYLRFQAAGIQTRQHFPFVHPVAFLHQNGGDALIVVEGQSDLAEIDVAVQDELHWCAVAVGKPPSRNAGASRPCDQVPEIAFPCKNQRVFGHFTRTIEKKNSLERVSKEIRFRLDR